MSFSIAGWDATYLVPRFVGQIIFGAGTLSAATARLACLLVGMKTSAGAMTADGDPVQVFSEDEADTQAGVGSQLARMAYKAFRQPAVDVWLACVTEPAGTAATVTILLGGSWTTSGTVKLRIAGEEIPVSVAAADPIDTVGANITAAINNRTRLPVTAAYNSGTDTITVTVRQLAAHGRDWCLYKDLSLAPSGLTLTLTGSSTINTVGVKFGASGTGTGSPTYTTLQGKLLNKRWARIAMGENDATSAASWETHVDAKAAFNLILLEHVIYGHNGSYATASSLAQTTLNHVRSQVLWALNCESHPCEIAARKAALRCATENTFTTSPGASALGPVPDYDGKVLDGIAYQRFDADIATDSQQNTALNNSLTPLVTSGTDIRIVRSTTSKSLTGSLADLRTLDIGDAVFPDFALLDLKGLYEGEFRPANPLVGPDPAEGEPEPPEGVGYPRLWNSKVVDRMRFWYDKGWIESFTGVAAPVSEYSVANKAIVTTVPLYVRRVQHQLGVIARQISNT